MAHVDDVNVRREWVEMRQVGSGRLYAALKPSGFLSISGWTHERMGSPDSYLLLVERADARIATAFTTSTSEHSTASTTPSAEAAAAPPKTGGELRVPHFLGRRGVRAIGLKAAVLGRDKNAYRVSRQKPGTNRNRTIFVRPLCAEFGIVVERTVVFHKCEIDCDGVLVLNLADARPLAGKD